MPAVKDLSLLDMVSQGGPESWTDNLPHELRAYRTELESLLYRMFNGKPESQHNFELAQQLTMNWCISKSKKIGLEIAD